MNEKTKEAVTQKLEDLDDEAGRQLLDYIEFLESKYNRSTRDQTTFERLAENVEGTLRGSRLGDAAIKGTEGILDAAGTVARGVAAAGQAVLDELQQVGGDPSKKAESDDGDSAAETRNETAASDSSEPVSEDGAPPGGTERESDAEAKEGPA